jgi:hypothetical protein
MTKMNHPSRLNSIVAVAALFCLVLCLFVFSLAGKVPVTAGAQTQPVSPANGLQIVTVDTAQGRVTIKLPDDIRTGDTISGTMTVEPKGASDEERAKNSTAVKSRVVRLLLTRARKPDEAPKPMQSAPVTLTVPLSGGSTSTVQTSRGPGNATRLEFLVTAPSDFALAPEVRKIADAEFGSAVVPVDANPSATTDPKPGSRFIIPPLGQTGRPVVITGPFDGKSSNTDVKLTEPTVFKKTSTYQDGIALPVIAESPRKAVIELPVELTGPAQISVSEGGVQTSGSLRNVGVNLTAQKTNLLRGERTSRTVVVSGLQGIETPVRLTLTVNGVITMQGGPQQELTIQPSQVGADGTYSTTREITGVQPGAWGAKATIITYP